MVVDTSAVLAIFMHEPEREIFTRRIWSSSHPVISAINYVESATVIASRKGANGEKWFDEFMLEQRIDVASVTAEIAMRARRAYALYGKGYHPARLNLGDTFAYALAKCLNYPLLFKGDDFRKTDVIAAL
jgi:ribonuclease VapC